MRYIIHACPQRMWYVEKFLVPSMQDQWLDPEVRCDTERRGCLEACMNIFASMEGDGGAWHMQDDVIICRNFAERTKSATNGVVNGFVWTKGAYNDIGIVNQRFGWNSFQCTYIQNDIARGCAEWFYSEGRIKHKQLAETGRFDDCFFRLYLQECHSKMNVLNLKPNLVDHIDFLIGGTVVSFDRKEKECRSAWFEDLDLVEELAKKLS